MGKRAEKQTPFVTITGPGDEDVNNMSSSDSDLATEVYEPTQDDDRIMLASSARRSWPSI
jgi:hypothetical protein